MKSVVITGCNRGLGLGLVRHLLRHDKSPEILITTCRNTDKAEELHEICKTHKNVYVLKLDVTNFEQHAEFVSKVKGIVQDIGLNVLFNNAGVSPKYTRLQYVKADQMLDTFKTNTVAPIVLAKNLLPLLKQAADNNAKMPLGCSKAAIVNMSSVLGSIELNKDGGLYPYKCSKAALNQATASMALDLKDYGIMSVALHPGWVKTSMGGTKAPMEVDQSASALVKLLFEMNESHNGGFIQWDGKRLPY